MRIKEAKCANPAVQQDKNEAVVQLTYWDVSEIARALYKVMGKNEKVKKLYSDFMILHQLLETGTLDDWTLERVAIHRGMKNIEQVDNDDPSFLPVKVIKSNKGD